MGGVSPRGVSRGMASSRGRRSRPLLAALLGLTLLAGGCQGGGVSEAGRERCRRLSAGAGDPVRGALSYLRCLPDSDRRLAMERAAMEQQAAARREALDACRRRQRRITTLMDSLRSAEQELAAARNSSFLPSVPPPRPLDAGRESRYRPEDQRLDRERYEQALGAWEQQVAPAGPLAPAACGPRRHRPGAPRPGRQGPESAAAGSVHRTGQHRIRPRGGRTAARRLQRLAGI